MKEMLLERERVFDPELECRSCAAVKRRERMLKVLDRPLLSTVDKTRFITAVSVFILSITLLKTGLSTADRVLMILNRILFDRKIAIPDWWSLNHGSQTIGKSTAIFSYF